MSFQDKTIHCADCGTDFSFTAEEQEFYQSRGCTNELKRCPSCRQARKTERLPSKQRVEGSNPSRDSTKLVTPTAFRNRSYDGRPLDHD